MWSIKYLFGSLFGKAPISIEDAVKKSKETMRTLERKEREFRTNMEKLRNSIKKNIKSGQKDFAKFNLKRVKSLERHLKNLEQKKLTLEAQVLQLEEAEMNR